MEVLLIEGAVPGTITATVSHEAKLRRLQVELAKHPNGGWRARTAGGEWGLRCNAVATAILLEASEIFAAELESAPQMAMAAD